MANVFARFLSRTAVALAVWALLCSSAFARERPYQNLIERVAEEHGIEPRLMAALVDVESNRRPDAVSPKGARGLAQLMPATAERFDVADPHDPEDNLQGAAKYLRLLLERFDGNTPLALAAYNAGEGAVDRAGGVPNYPETRDFVRKVLTRAKLKHTATARDGGARDNAARGPEPVRLVRNADGSVLLTNRH